MQEACGHPPLLVHWQVGVDAEAVPRAGLFASPGLRRTRQEIGAQKLLAGEALSLLVDGGRV